MVTSFRGDTYTKVSVKVFLVETFIRVTEKRKESGVKKKKVVTGMNEPNIFKIMNHKK